MIIWANTLIAFALLVAACDLAWRKIPKALVIGGFLLGLGYHLFQHDLHAAIFAALIAFGGATLLFSIRAIGGGDAKLIIAMGAMLGVREWLIAIAASFIAAAFIGLGQAIWNRRVKQTFRNLWILLQHIRHSGLQAHGDLNVRESATLRSPFGVAAAIGICSALWLERMVKP
jgi:prepilin peptidase CpaA